VCVCVCVCVASTCTYDNMIRVGQNHTVIGIYGVHTVFLAGKLPYIRPYTVCIYGSGQPYTYSKQTVLANPFCMKP